MHKRLVITSVIALVMVAAGAGIAIASIPGPDGVIHGCYKTSGPAQGALTVIDSTASCPSGTAALNWNQTGPQGAAGPSTGGSTGLDLQIILATGTTTATANCPSDHPFLFGGGGYDPGLSLVISAPAGLPSSSEAETGNTPLGWEVVASNNANDTVFAYAICGK